MVIDYRKINGKTNPDKYQIPNISKLFGKLGKCTYFTTLDLANGFHQIEVNPDSVPKRVFSMENSHFEYRWMLFELMDVPGAS